MKTLVLVFKTNGNGKMNISIANPKEEITLEEAKGAAEKLIPILITSAGADISAFENANIVTTTTETLE